MEVKSKTNKPPQETSTRFDLREMLRNMPKFEVIEKVKDNLYYIVEKRDSHYYPLKQRSPSYTKTLSAAKRILTLYCKRNGIENYITSLRVKKEV